MSDGFTIKEILIAIFGVAGTVIGSLLVMVIKSAVTEMISLKIRVELMTQKLDKFDGFEKRLEDVEEDCDKAHEKIRNIAPLNGGK